MDHREKMQKEAEAWQVKSVKLIRLVRYGVLALGVLVLLVLFLRNAGFPKTVDETHTASIITADGQVLECIVEIQGQVTEYPLNKVKSGLEDNVVVYANGTRILSVSLYGDRSAGFVAGQNQKAVCILSNCLDAMILETDLRNIFPNMDSQPCLVYFGYESFDIPGEYAEHFTMLNN